MFADATAGLDPFAADLSEMRSPVLEISEDVPSALHARILASKSNASVQNIDASAILARLPKERIDYRPKT